MRVVKDRVTGRELITKINGLQEPVNKLPPLQIYATEPRRKLWYARKENSLRGKPMEKFPCYVQQGGSNCRKSVTNRGSRPS